MLPHWNTPVAGTWQEHPNQSHYKLTPDRPAIFPSTYLSMRSASKEVLVPSLRTFGMSRLGIELATFHTPSKHSTIKSPGPVSLTVITLLLLSIKMLLHSNQCTFKEPLLLYLKPQVLETFFRNFAYVQQCLTRHFCSCEMETTSKWRHVLWNRIFVHTNFHNSQEVFNFNWISLVCMLFQCTYKCINIFPTQVLDLSE